MKRLFLLFALSALPAFAVITTVQSTVIAESTTCPATGSVCAPPAFATTPVVGNLGLMIVFLNGGGATVSSCTDTGSAGGSQWVVGKSVAEGGGGGTTVVLIYSLSLAANITAPPSCNIPNNTGRGAQFIELSYTGNLIAVGTSGTIAAFDPASTTTPGPALSLTAGANSLIWSGASGAGGGALINVSSPSYTTASEGNNFSAIITNVTTGAAPTWTFTANLTAFQAASIAFVETTARTCVFGNTTTCPEGLGSGQGNFNYTTNGNVPIPGSSPAIRCTIDGTYSTSGAQPANRTYNACWQVNTPVTQTTGDICVSFNGGGDTGGDANGDFGMSQYAQWIFLSLEEGRCTTHISLNYTKYHGSSGLPSGATNAVYGATITDSLCGFNFIGAKAGVLFPGNQNAIKSWAFSWGNHVLMVSSWNPGSVTAACEYSSPYTIRFMVINSMEYDFATQDGVYAAAQPGYNRTTAPAGAWPTGDQQTWMQAIGGAFGSAPATNTSPPNNNTPCSPCSAANWGAYPQNGTALGNYNPRSYWSPTAVRVAGIVDGSLDTITNYQYQAKIMIQDFGSNVLPAMIATSYGSCGTSPPSVCYGHGSDQTLATAGWQSSITWVRNMRIQDSNGHVQVCTVGGAGGGGSAPTWKTNGTTTTDGSATWLDLGVDPTGWLYSNSGAFVFDRMLDAGSTHSGAAGGSMGAGGTM